METINNVASGVSKAIWGEGNTTQANETAGNEPISGQTGKGTVDSPYDQGNSENAADPTNNKPIGLYDQDKSSSSTPNPTSTATGTTTGASAGSLTEGSGVSKVTDVPGTNESSKPLENTDKTGVTSKTGDPTKASDIIPSESQSNTGAPSGGADKQKQQGADRPLDEPEKELTTEDYMKKRDPNDHSGEPMRVHDGSEEKKIPDTQEERRTSKVGLPGGQEHGKEPKGTGEEWVKTSGLQADGGDFDATKPGAGREADRLLEEKGVKKTESGTSGGKETTTSTGSGEKKEKVSKVEKLKEKLHIGHKDK